MGFRLESATTKQMARHVYAKLAPQCQSGVTSLSFWDGVRLLRRRRLRRRRQRARRTRDLSLESFVERDIVVGQDLAGGAVELDFGSRIDGAGGDFVGLRRG